MTDTCGVIVQPGNLPSSRPLLKFTAQIGGRQGTVMVDSGATSNFISESFITRNHIPSTTLSPRHNILLADGTTHSVTRQIRSLPLTFTGFTGPITAHILPLHDYDVILGMPWLAQHNPRIDWQRRALAFNDRTTQPPPSPSSPPRYTIRILTSGSSQKTTPPADRLYVITDQKELDRLQRTGDTIQWLCHLEQTSEHGQNPSAMNHLTSHSLSLLQCHEREA